MPIGSNKWRGMYLFTFVCLHFLFTFLCLQNILKEEKELLESLKAPNGELRFESASAAFEAAIELGLKYRNNDICSKRYLKCVWLRTLKYRPDNIGLYMC